MATEKSVAPPLKMTRVTLEILAVLMTDDPELYGLKIAETIGKRTGTVYPILLRLERADWVTSEWEFSLEGESPRRKFYSLTTRGRQAARAALHVRSEQQKGFFARLFVT